MEGWHTERRLVMSISPSMMRLRARAVAGEIGVVCWGGVVLFRQDPENNVLVFTPDRKIDRKVPWAYYEEPTENFEDGCVGKKISFPADMPVTHLWQTPGETIDVFSGENLWNVFRRCLDEEAGVLNPDTCSFFDADGEEIRPEHFRVHEHPFHIGNRVVMSQYGTHNRRLLTTYAAGNAPNFFFGQVVLAKVPWDETFVAPDKNDVEVTKHKWWPLNELRLALQETPEQFFGLHWEPLRFYTDHLAERIARTDLAA